jgi:RHS repeat-associated protein
MKVGSGYYFYHNDHLGTPQKLTAVNGAVVWSAKYSSFGEAAVEVETVENNLRFPGQYFDEETGLHYNWHRYYDPTIGRYLRADPIGLDAGINLFLYVRNNPVNWIDPWGLDAMDSFWHFNGRPNYPKMPHSPLFKPLDPKQLQRQIQWYLKDFSPPSNNPWWAPWITGEREIDVLWWTPFYLFGEIFTENDMVFYPPFSSPNPPGPPEKACPFDPNKK